MCVQKRIYNCVIFSFAPLARPAVRALRPSRHTLPLLARARLDSSQRRSAIRTQHARYIHHHHGFSIMFKSFFSYSFFAGIRVTEDILDLVTCKPQFLFLLKTIKFWAKRTLSSLHLILTDLTNKVYFYIQVAVSMATRTPSRAACRGRSWWRRSVS